jgi:hypothetical protein
VSGGEAARQLADQAHAVRGQVEHRGGGDGQHDHDQDRRRLRQPVLQREDEQHSGEPDGGGRGDRLAAREAPQEAADLPDEALGADAEAEQLGQLPDQDGERQAVQVAHDGRLGQQVRHEAQAGDRPADQQHRHQDRQHRGQRDGARAVLAAGGQRQDGRGDQRPERGVRTQDQDPARAEDRVGEQAGDGGVEAGDGWQPGQFGVRHALGHEQSAQHDSGHDVLERPASLVDRRCLQARYRMPDGQSASMPEVDPHRCP